MKCRVRSELDGVCGSASQGAVIRDGAVNNGDNNVLLFFLNVCVYGMR